MALAHPATAFVATWGLSDKYTWLDEPEFRHFGWTTRPLPLDASMRRKTVWQAAAEAFDHAPKRTPLANREGVIAPALEAATASPKTSTGTN